MPTRCDATQKPAIQGSASTSCSSTASPICDAEALSRAAAFSLSVVLILTTAAETSKVIPASARSSPTMRSRTSLLPST